VPSDTGLVCDWDAVTGKSCKMMMMTVET